MEFSFENVEAVISSFYNGGGYSEEAHQWLVEAQRSPHAWNFVWACLLRGKPETIQYFGVNTLIAQLSAYSGIIKETGIDSDDEDSSSSPTKLGVKGLLELRDVLLSKLFELASDESVSRGVITKLCVAFSHTTFLLAPEHWKGVVAVLLSMFEQLKAPVLLELLRVLPEEFYTAPLPHFRRCAVRQELQDGVSQIMELFEVLLHSQQASAEHITGIILACSAWLQFSVAFSDRQQLLALVCRAAQDPRFFDAAVDCLCNVFSHPDSNKYPNTVRTLLPCVLALKPLLLQAIHDTCDMETVAGVCRLITTLCESHCNLLLDLCCRNDGDASLELFSLLLQCTDLPQQYPTEETVSEMTASFWYILQDDIVSSDESRCHLLSQLLRQVFVQLTMALLRKSRYPDWQLFASWNEEDKERFRCYRQDIGDTLLYSYNVLRNGMLQLAVNYLEDLILRKCDSQSVESVLFLVHAVSEGILERVGPEEDSQLCRLFIVLATVPLEHPKAVQACLSLVGAYQEWMTDHPELLRNLLPAVLACLRDPELLPSASAALRSVCQINAAHIVLHISEILETINAVLVLEATPAEAARLMACLGSLVPVLPPHQSTTILQRICDPHLLSLERLSQSLCSYRSLRQESAEIAATRSALVAKLGMFSWLFTSLQGCCTSAATIDTSEKLFDTATSMVSTGSDDVARNAIVYMLTAMLPLLRNIANSSCLEDVAVGAALADLLRWAVRRCDEAPMNLLLGDVAHLVSRMLAVAPNSPLLELAGHLALSWSACTPAACDVLASACQAALSRLQVEDNGGKLRNSTDMLEALMQMTQQVAHRRPALLRAAIGVGLSSLLQVALTAFSFPETGTVRHAAAFLAECTARHVDLNCRDLLIDQGPFIVDRALRGVAGESPRQVTDHVADVLGAFVRHFPTETRRWILELLSLPDYPSDRLTRQDKDRFSSMLFQCRSSRRSTRDVVREMGLKCRGLYATTYANATTSLLNL